MAVQSLKPRIDMMKARYGDDQAKIKRETNYLYEQAGVNPLAGAALCWKPLARTTMVGSVWLQLIGLRTSIHASTRWQVRHAEAGPCSEPLQEQRWWALFSCSGTCYVAVHTAVQQFQSSCGLIARHPVAAAHGAAGVQALGRCAGPTAGAEVVMGSVQLGPVSQACTHRASRRPCNHIAASLLLTCCWWCDLVLQAACRLSPRSPSSSGCTGHSQTWPQRDCWTLRCAQQPGRTRCFVPPIMIRSWCCA
jgi:hypothetical protein